MKKPNYVIAGIPNGGITVIPNPKKLIKILHWGGILNWKFGSMWFKKKCIISW